MESWSRLVESWSPLMDSRSRLVESWSPPSELLESTSELVESTSGLVESTSGLAESIHGLTESLNFPFWSVVHAPALARMREGALRNPAPRSAKRERGARGAADLPAAEAAGTNTGQFATEARHANSCGGRLRGRTFHPHRYPALALRRERG